MTCLGCSKDDTGTNNTNNGTSSMSATVGTTSWTATSVVSQKVFGKINVNGIGAGGTGIQFAIDTASAKVGNVSFGFTNIAVYSSGTSAYTTASLASSGDVGKMTITAADANHIAGTFNFVGRPATGSTGDSVVVTNGTFNAKY
jgi:hypothetical protein